MQTNQGNPSVSGETERVSSRELAQMLEERGIPVPGQVAVANQSVPSPASSSATNPFTSIELANIYKQGRIAATAPSDDELQDVPQDGPQQLHPSVRIIIEYSHAISIDVAPVGSTDSDAEAASRQSYVELNATQSGPNSFRKLGVIQSKKDLGVAIKATTAAKKDLLLHWRLSFDSVADRIVIANHGFKPIVAKPLEGGSPAQPGQPIELKPYFAQILEPGSWAIFSAPGQHILDLSILPRRNITIARRPGEPVELALLGTKRQHDLSQPTTGEAKKVKSRADDSAAQASIVFQPAPKALEAQADPRLHLAPDQQNSLAARGEGNIVIGLHHPFEDLHAGDMAKIIGPDNEDYTLSYDKTISLRSNSHVFTAQYSGLPEKLVVVKVVRSPSGPIAPGESRQVAERVQRTGEVWLKEVRIHSKLSQHNTPSVVRLHDHDARFLAIYMENIYAPSLDQYPCSTMTRADQTRVLHDVSTALYYIYRQGFVHNDIKPGNILFSQARGAVLIDFGLSTELTERDVHTGGTPWYIPPEFAELGKRGTPGDIFALGVVMLYVLGRLPLPERYDKRLRWRIGEALTRRSKAADAMSSWQEVVKDASRGLNTASSKLERLVGEMVVGTPADRVALDKLVEESSALPRDG